MFDYVTTSIITPVFRLLPRRAVLVSILSDM